MFCRILVVCMYVCCIYRIYYPALFKLWCSLMYISLVDKDYFKNGCCCTLSDNPWRICISCDVSSICIFEKCALTNTVFLHYIHYLLFVESADVVQEKNINCFHNAIMGYSLIKRSKCEENTNVDSAMYCRTGGYNTTKAIDYDIVWILWIQWEGCKNCSKGRWTTRGLQR